MKKVFILAAAVLLVLASCKKDYTCVCTINGSSASTTYEDVKKKDAEASCESLETTAKFLDPNASCSI